MTVAEQLRSAITASDETHYKIGKEAGISPSILDRFVSGETDYLGGRNIDRLCDHLGLELCRKKAQTTRKQAAKKTATKRKRRRKSAE